MKKALWMVGLLVVAMVAFGANFGGNFVYLMGSDAVTLLPANMNDNPSETVTRHIFDGLVEFNEQMEIIPALAEKWEVSEDGTVYTFYLRQGVKFHDGADFNAQAVKTYYDFMVGGTMRRSSLLRPYIKEIKVISDHVVAFHLNFPFGSFLNYLSHGASLIASPKSIEQYGHDVGELGRRPAGTGPFSLVRWQPAQSIVLKANEDYWGGRPYLDQIEFRIMPEDITRVVQVQSGDAHLTPNAPPVMLRRLEADPSLKIRIEPSLRTIYLGFDNRKEPFTDIRVRQAINYAIDKERLVRVIMRGMAQPSDSPLAPLTMGYASTGGYPYNPEKARQLLQDAGYPDGLSFEFVTPQGRYLQDYETAIAVQAMLAEVNIDVDVQPMEWARYISFIFTDPDKASYEMYLLGWAPSTGEADWVLRPLFTSTNLPPSGDNASYYANPKVDELIQAGMREVDHDKRMEIYRQAQQQIVDDAAWAFLYSLNQLVVHSNRVEGVEVLPIEVVIVKNAWLK